MTITSSRPSTAGRIGTVSFTTFSSTERLSKLFQVGADERILKISGTRFAAGEARRIDIVQPSATAVLEDFGNVVRRLSSKEAIGTGIAKNGQTVNRIVTAKKKANGADGISRTLEHFTFHSGPGIVLIDGDDVSELRERLVVLYPEFARVASLSRPSASAGIRNADTGETLEGSGEHLYCLVSDVSRSRELLDGWMRLAWCRNQGQLKVAANGALLVRGPCDVTTGSPERLSYEGQCELLPPIEQVSDRALTLVEGGMLHVPFFLAMVDREAQYGRFELLKDRAAADPAIIEQQRRAHATYVKRVIARKVDSGVPADLAEEEAEEERKAFVPGKMQSGRATAILHETDVFEASDGRIIPLRDIIANPAAFDRLAGADPGEGPGYGISTAMVFANDGNPTINSHAHGGILYAIRASDSQRSRERQGGKKKKAKSKRNSDYGADQLIDDDEDGGDGTGQGGGEGEMPEEETALPVVSAFPINASLIPLRPWIVLYLLLRGHVTFLAAPPSVGKSLFTLQLAIAVALGIRWGAWTPRKPAKVLVVNIEDDFDELRRRLWAAAESMGVDQDDLADRIMLYDASAGCVVAKADARSKTIIAQPVVKRLEATIRERGIDVTVIDPFSETFEGDENSNSELKWVGALYRGIARNTNSCVLLNAHTRKNAANAAGDPDAMRGAGALVGIGRVVVTLFPMTPAEGDALGIDPAERNRFVRFDDGKVNFSLKNSSSIPQSALWLRKLSVQLPNGTDEGPGDWVGVFEPWEPPKAFAALDIGTLNSILDDISRGLVDASGSPTGTRFTRYKSRSSRWVGLAIQARAPGKSDHDADTISKAWLKSGLLREDNYYDPHQRKDLKGLFVVDAKRPGTEG